MQFLLLLALAAAAEGRPAFMVVKVEPAELRPGQTAKVTAELRDERHQRWMGKTWITFSVLGGLGDVDPELVEAVDGRASVVYKSTGKIGRGQSVTATVRASSRGVWNQTLVTTTAPRIGH